jgi:UDP-N-acetylmuramate: L-alanyl-gamma-D-glutamyl-meso-diaminopimelate ligase
MQKIVETENAIAFKDFAHSPSKLKATITAVKAQFPSRKLVACMELHTFSSLTEAFLPEYKNCMEQADMALVYFNPNVIKHKNLKEITSKDVLEAFGGDNVQVFTNSLELQSVLKNINYQNKSLLMMSSGNFDGLNVVEFVESLLKK